MTGNSLPEQHTRANLTQPAPTPTPGRSVFDGEQARCDVGNLTAKSWTEKMWFEGGLANTHPTGVALLCVLENSHGHVSAWALGRQACGNLQRVGRMLGIEIVLNISREPVSEQGEGGRGNGCMGRQL